MSFEFDHLFIFTDVGASAADRLVALGLAEGTANVHPGQGTANRRFFFHNAMVELLWVHDSAEAQSERIRETHLWERWVQRNEDICPFGICLRSTDRGSIAFPYWDFRPPYLPDTFSIAVGNIAVPDPVKCRLFSESLIRQGIYGIVLYHTRLRTAIIVRC
jgi:Glyoxalase-like domain